MGWRRAVSFRHLVERTQDSETALVQIFPHEGRSRALGKIRFGAVLARKKSAGQRKVRNHGDVFAHAKRRQLRFEPLPLVKVVVRLQTLVPRQTLFLTDLLLPPVSWRCSLMRQSRALFPAGSAARALRAFHAVAYRRHQHATDIMPWSNAPQTPNGRSKKVGPSR